MKKAYYIFLILFGLLFIYHIVRFYIIDADCDYIVGDLNQSIEATLFFTGIVTALLSITQIVSSAILKKSILIIINVLILISIFGSSSFSIKLVHSFDTFSHWGSGTKS